MHVRINSKEYPVTERVNTLEELVIHLKLRKGNTLLKRNGRPVSWKDWPDVTLQEDDLIEILTFVGGG